jgi:HIV-1 Vpr-binding protein
MKYLFFFFIFSIVCFRLVNDYLRENYFTRQNINKSSFLLNIAACRLILIIMPGLETSAVFQASNEHLINRLYDWVEKAEEPLKSYATGLLGSSMELQDIAVAYRDQNTRILPMLLQRLKNLQLQHSTNGNTTLITNGNSGNSNVENDDNDFEHLPATQEEDNSQSSNVSASSESARNTMISLYPPTLATSQMLILRYLTPMGEYQEFLPFIFEHDALGIIFEFIDKGNVKELSCLTFESLKYLASLLCHKKCCIEFLARNGLQKLLKLPRQSTIATGIAIALYYIAYCEEAMERICSMSPRIITELVGYALGLLSCNHDSGRCHATMFFGLSFQFKPMLDEFDQQDGIRQLYNVISILPILSQTSEDYNLTADEENAERQVIRHVCVSLKKYFESHLFFKYTQVMRNSTKITVPLRALKNPVEVIDDQILTLQNILPMKSTWQPVQAFLHLNGVTLFILVIAHSYEWNYSGRSETVRSVLDVLNICCVVPRVHAVLCERIDFPDEVGSAAGFSIIVSAAEGDIVSDPDVQKSALSLLVNCVCAPIHRTSGNVARFGSGKKKLIDRNSEELIKLVWETVRSNNGIIVLLQLMTIKTPITDADYIRGMACRALAGLARSETVRQILSKLPLFVNGQLQQLCKDPILQEKRSEHVQFQKYALELLERVSGKPTNIDTSLANIHKANVVAQTKIQYNEQHLYMLIHKHLIDNGMQQSAETLLKEAKLEQVISQQHQQVQQETHKINVLPNSNANSPFSFRSPMIQRSRINKKAIDNLNNSNCNLETSITDATTSVLKSQSDCSGYTSSSTLFEDQQQQQQQPMLSSTTPIKIIKKAIASTSLTNVPMQSQPQFTLEKQPTTEIFLTASVPLAIGSSSRNLSSVPKSTNITLNTIITEYLTNQHSLCKNPMSTCPTFNLFEPHKCPDPRPNRNINGMSVNFATRFFKRHQGFSSVKLDRKFVHTNFNIARTLRIPDVDLCFTTCDFFTAEGSSLMIGTQNGEVRVLHINDSSEDFSASCSDSYINNLKCSRDNKLVLTSGTWHTPLSVLWSVENKQFVSKLNFDEEEYVEFSNVVQDKVLGTKGEKATIYDMHTGQVVRTLEPTIFNQYSKNRATFCPNDELILSDGVLWDAREGQQIHKFDKLNNTLSGVFHPNGLEVVSNTEVWDLRTFHLLRTIPALDQCQLKFSPQNVIYAFNVQSEAMEEVQGELCKRSLFKFLF